MLGPRKLGTRTRSGISPEGVKFVSPARKRWVRCDPGAESRWDATTSSTRRQSEERIGPEALDL